MKIHCIAADSDDESRMDVRYFVEGLLFSYWLTPLVLSCSPAYRLSWMTEMYPYTIILYTPDHSSSLHSSHSQECIYEFQRQGTATPGAPSRPGDPAPARHSQRAHTQATVPAQGESFNLSEVSSDDDTDDN